MDGYIVEVIRDGCIKMNGGEFLNGCIYGHVDS